MKFHTLRIQNFLTIGDATVQLKDKGLHLIQGENEDNTSAKSNGAGKSSIVDAISWVLFGVTARGTKGDKVVHNVRKKDCFVELRVEHGESTYIVERYRKHATHKNQLRLYCDATPASSSVDMTKGTDAETQKLVEPGGNARLAEEDGQGSQDAGGRSCRHEPHRGRLRGCP
jgi:DNA repair exonuclease SbcCD ATPase subunit